MERVSLELRVARKERTIDCPRAALDCDKSAWLRGSKAMTHWVHRSCNQGVSSAPPRPRSRDALEQILVAILAIPDLVIAACS